MTGILIRKEIEKLLSIRMIPCIFILFLILNAISAASALSHESYLSFISVFSQKHGLKADGMWRSTLEGEEENEYRNRLLSETADTYDPFDDYDTESVYEILGQYWPMCNDSELLKNKYRRLQKVTDKLAASDAALDVSAAGETYRIHSFLFSELMPLISAEIIILAAACAALSATYEFHAGTREVIVSKTKGRDLYWLKYSVSFSAVVIMSILLILAALLQMIFTMDPRSFIDSSVSSYFNFRMILLSAIPFMTWLSMNTMQYLAAQCALSILLGIFVHAACFAAGSFFENALHIIGLFILYISLNLAVILAVSGLENFTLYSLCMMNPVAVWLNQSSWFTDGDISSLIPMQETLTMCVYLLLSIAGLKAGRNHCKRKDILS